MKDKLIAISGANDGIGFASAEALLEKGASLVFFCRNLEKAEAAKKQLLNKNPSYNIEIIQADMASFASIKNACAQFLKQHDKLDVLLNNAGVMRTKFELTEDGFEHTMAVNHFAYFLMTYHLFPALRNAESARIVNVASEAHYDVELDLDKINTKGHFNFRKQYKCSKLANVFFTRKLAQLLKAENISVNCLDPGLVKTRIGNKAGGKLLDWAWTIFTLRGISPKEGAKTSVYLASSPEVEGLSGVYFEECAVKEISKEAQDDKSMNALWEWTLENTGLEKWPL